MIPGPADAAARASFWDRFDAMAPPLLQIGLRASTWALYWGPIAWIGRMRSFAGLDADGQDAVFARVARHRWYAIRQLVVPLKLVAAFAVSADPIGRARLLPDRP